MYRIMSNDLLIEKEKLFTLADNKTSTGDMGSKLKRKKGVALLKGWLHLGIA